jgi:choline dehydrogenase-like flavoprotein
MTALYLRKKQGREDNGAKPSKKCNQNLNILQSHPNYNIMANDVKNKSRRSLLEKTGTMIHATNCEMM